MELQSRIGFLAVTAAIARVQDESVMRRIFQKYRPFTVFHAAAYKHVPLMEINPWQAVENNIIGSYTTMKCARDSGVKRFVLVSTDKAVRPTNVMGCTKRVTELVMHAFANRSDPNEAREASPMRDTDPGEGQTVFMAVRFGNVLGSSGSVVPLFRRQIERGGPVTVTHPDVTRYFMTIPEASRLILQAGTLGEGGEIFILHMGTPVKIADMARDLIRLSGKEPDVDIKIEFTGLRPGEKLYEELITEGEGIVPTRCGKIMVLRPENGVDIDWIEARLDELKALAAQYDGDKIKAKLSEMVPEYVSQSADAVL
jgi:FlaA1/EpsC-like NDP-sugar epimerase